MSRRRGKRTRYLSETGLCVVDGCGRPHKAKGYCIAHYGQMRDGKTPGQIGPARWRGASMYDGLECLVVGCGRKPHSRSLCNSHYHAALKIGADPADLSRGDLDIRQGCAICGTTDGGRSGWKKRSIILSIDHDHATGAIRGFLCSRCNHGLGHFRDSPERLRAAADYIERTSMPRGGVSE